MEISIAEGLGGEMASALMLLLPRQHAQLSLSDTKNLIIRAVRLSGSPTDSFQEVSSFHSYESAEIVV